MPLPYGLALTVTQSKPSFLGWGICYSNEQKYLTHMPSATVVMLTGLHTHTHTPVTRVGALTVFLIEELLHLLSEDHLLPKSVGVILICREKITLKNWHVLLPRDPGLQGSSPDNAFSTAAALVS